MYSTINRHFLSDNEINSGRQNELDLAKAVLAFCLALVHCIIECTSDEGLTSGIPYLFDTIIGGPFGAPMFMFVMGVGMVYTAKNRPEDHLARGFKLFVGAYIFNACRFFMPYMIGYGITGEHEKYIEPLMYKVLGNDILTFAGLAMMLIALLIKYKVSNVGLVVISIIFSVVGTMLIGVDVGAPLGNIFLGYLIGTEDAAGMVLSDFPLLNWLIFPACGYVFGSVLKRVKDKDSFYLIVSIPALVAAAIYFAFGLHYNRGMFGEGQNCYYHMIVGDALASLALNIGMLGVYHFVSKVLPRTIMKLSRNISANLTAVYCIHWVLVSFIVNIFIYIVRGTQELPAGLTLLLGSAISVASIIIAHYFHTWKKRRGV